MAVDFAVWHEGIEEGQGRWVMYVDPAGERVLLVADDKTFYWRALSECTMYGLMGPEQPRPVMVVQPQAQPQIFPAGMMLNRDMRRNGRN